MSRRKCYMCGRDPAAGYASIWTPEHGNRWYCHGDDDDPTCYQRGSWALSGLNAALHDEFGWQPEQPAMPDFLGWDIYPDHIHVDADGTRGRCPNCPPEVPGALG